MNHKSTRLAVVVKGWPRLSETFIAQELLALERSGIDFEIWSLRHPTDTKTHPLHDQLHAPVRYLPEYLKDEPLRVMKGLADARQHYGFAEAWRAFRADFARDRTPNRIRRFGQACVLARELPTETKALYAHFLHTPSSVARYASIICGLPWSFSAHAKDIWTSPEWELREKLSQTTNGAAFGATCTQFGAEYLKSLSDREDRVDLIYHGLDLSRFPDPPERRPRTPEQPLSLISVGRLVEKKGFDRLIEALALLPDELHWQWVHVGGGPMKSELQKLARDLGVNHNITWRGACDQPEVIAEMRRSDLFVLPSRIAADGDRDGLPNVLMEAASQKLPILSTPVSAIPEFVEDGVHGILTEDTPSKLAQAIEAFAAMPDNGMLMAESAYNKLISEFRMEPGIARLARHLHKLVGKTEW